MSRRLVGVKLGVKLERLRLKPGDVLVVTYDGWARINLDAVLQRLQHVSLGFSVPIVVKERGVRFRVQR